MDALYDVLAEMNFRRPNSVEAMLGHLYPSDLIADLACLSFNTLYALYEAERKRTYVPHGYARLSGDMKQAVGYRCEKCGCKEGSGLVDPAAESDMRHVAMCHTGATVRLRLHFINRNFYDWNPLNIQVLCMDCCKAVENAKSVAYNTKATHKSIDGGTDDVKKKARPKKDKPETRKERVVRERNEAGQQSFI